MSLSVDKLSNYKIKPNYFSVGFRTVIEDHLDYIRNDRRSNVIVVDPHMAMVYTGDFYGLLIKYGIPINYCWIITRINNLYSPQDYKGDVTDIIVPDYGFIDLLLGRFMNG